MLATIFAAVCLGFVSSTPIHDNTIGVTECQDCLRDLYPGLSYRKQPGENFDCDEGVVELFDCLSSCRPSDPMRILAYLREITLARNWNKCYNQEQNASKCEDALLCLYGAMDEKKFLCDYSEGQEQSKKCFMDMHASGCQYATKLSYAVEYGLKEHCNGAGCIDLKSGSPNIYRTVPEKECSEFKIIDKEGTVYNNMKVAAGTMFDASPDVCGLNHKSPDNCSI